MRRVMMRSVMIAAAVAGAAGLVEAQAAAPRVVRVGSAVEGTFAAGDVKYGSRGAFHAYRFDVKAGTRYQVTMRSKDFDSYLWIAHTVGVLTEELVNNDDDGGDMDARARFRARETGIYYVVAQALETAGTGAYTLTVEELPPAPEVTAVALPIGQAREGSLDDNSPVLDEGPGDIPYALYTFSGRGQRVRITLRSGAFDAMLRVTKVVAGGEEDVGNDDDSGGGTDAMLTLTANGDYRIYARPLEADSKGQFTIALSEVVVRPVTSRQIAIGQEITATLTAQDPELDDGRRFHQYAITGRPGERFILTMKSSAFDAFLDFGSLDGSTFESSSTDDDGAGGTDARLEITLPADGTFVVRAYGLEQGKLGEYTIKLERRSSK